MNNFQFFTIFGLMATLILGVINLILNIKNQRKSHRELVFQKQFEFFMKLQYLIAEFEDAITELSVALNLKLETGAILENIEKKADEIEIEITKNEIIIPDELYIRISNFSTFCYDIKLNDKGKLNISIQDFVNKNGDMVDTIREHLGIDKLSRENKKLVANKQNK